MTRRRAPEEHDAWSRWLRRHPVLTVLILLALVTIGLTFRFLKAMP